MPHTDLLICFVVDATDADPTALEATLDSVAALPDLAAAAVFCREGAVPAALRDDSHHPVFNKNLSGVPCFVRLLPPGRVSGGVLLNHAAAECGGRADLFVPLFAGEVVLPDAARLLARQFEDHPGEVAVAFGDWLDAAGGRVLARPYDRRRPGPPPRPYAVARAALAAAGPAREDAASPDADLFFRLTGHAAAVHVPEPLFAAVRAPRESP